MIGRPTVHTVRGTYLILKYRNRESKEIKDLVFLNVLNVDETSLHQDQDCLMRTNLGTWVLREMK